MCKVWEVPSTLCIPCSMFSFAMFSFETDTEGCKHSRYTWGWRVGSCHRAQRRRMRKLSRCGHHHRAGSWTMSHGRSTQAPPGWRLRQLKTWANHSWQAKMGSSPVATACCRHSTTQDPEIHTPRHSERRSKILAWLALGDTFPSRLLGPGPPCYGSNCRNSNHTSKSKAKLQTHQGLGNHQACPGPHRSAGLHQQAASAPPDPPL